MKAFLLFSLCCGLCTAVVRLVRLAIADYPRKAAIPRYSDVIELAIGLAITAWCAWVIFGGPS